MSELNRCMVPPLLCRGVMAEAARRLNVISATLTTKSVGSLKQELASVISLLTEPLFDLAFKCKALCSFDPPQECDWPICGCDEYAMKVIEASEGLRRNTVKFSVRTEPTCDPP